MNVTLAAVLFATSLATALANVDDKTAISVFVKDSDIYISNPGNPEPLRLTSDGAKKYFVALSSDGSRVVFTRQSKGTMADIVVMSSGGGMLREIRFRPPDANITGMRYVENLEWLTNKELVASGSVNPSTAEYAVIDTDTGKEVRGYFVEGSCWQPSPDGSHVAYEGFIPHFTPEEDRRPQFCIDDECSFDKPSTGYPGSQTHLEFTGNPIWSPDGAAVAMKGEDYATKTPLVVVRPLHGKPVRYSPPGGGSIEIAWDSKALVVRTGRDAWRLEPGTSIFVPSR